MPQGEVTSWDERAGRGTIVRDTASGELALHRSQCMGMPIKKGTRVSFGIAAAPKTGRPMAIDVRPAGDRPSCKLGVGNITFGISN